MIQHIPDQCCQREWSASKILYLSPAKLSELELSRMHTPHTPCESLQQLHVHVGMGILADSNLAVAQADSLPNHHIPHSHSHQISRPYSMMLLLVIVCVVQLELLCDENVLHKDSPLKFIWLSHWLKRDPPMVLNYRLKQRLG